MNFVPRPVMKSHSSHEDSRPLPGYERNKRGKWDRLHRRLAHSQPYLRVFTTSDRFIAEYLGVMLVMHKSVTLKYALEGRGTRTEKVPSVHQLPVHLVLDKGHQNARENEPATNLQNKHQISASWAWTLVASEATASSLVERGTMEVMGCPRGARETDGPSSEDSRRPSCREKLPPRCAVSLSLRVRPSRSRGVPCESLDAPENLPKEGPRQVAVSQLQDEVQGMPNEAPAGLEEPLLETRQRPALDGEGQDQPAQEIAEVVGDNPEEQADLIGPEPVTGEPGPVGGGFALL